MLQLKEGFLVHKVAGETVVIPSGQNEEINLNAMITLNDTALFLWHQLENGATEQSLIESLLKEYDVQRERAEKSVANFLCDLKNNGLLA